MGRTCSAITLLTVLLHTWSHLPAGAAAAAAALRAGLACPAHLRLSWHVPHPRPGNCCILRSCLPRAVLHIYPAVWDVAAMPYFSPYYFATAGADRTARLWSTDRVQPLRLFVGER